MDALRPAWESFQDGVNRGLEQVRPVILASWRRSNELGVPSDLGAGRDAGDVLALGPARPVDEELSAAGGASARELALDLDGARAVVVLSDATGTILLRAGSRDVTARTDAAHLTPGATWTEGAAGTNGIGLALAVGGPVAVVASEHYCEGWHEYACTTAPIRDPATGRVLGLLTLTTRAREHDGPVVAALVRRAAREAEGRLAERRRGDGRTLRDVERAAILAALQRTGGSATRAAEELGISRATLYRRLRTYRVLGPQDDGPDRG